LAKRDRDLPYKAIITIGIVLAIAPLIKISPMLDSSTMVSGLYVPKAKALLMAFFIVYSLPVTLYTVGLTIYAYRKEKDRSDKMRLLIWLCGIIAGFLFLTTVDFILPRLFNDLRFASYGPLTVIIVEIFAWWSVVRHNFLLVNIRQLEEIIGKVFQDSGDAFLLLNRLDKIVYVNNAAAGLFGAGSEAARDLSLAEILPGYAKDTAFSNFETTLRLPGKDLSVLVSKTKLRAADETVNSLLTIRDITQVKRAEDARLRMQKLEALGILAGGIAHDFNNILCGIVSTFNAIKIGARLDTELKEILIMGEQTALSAQSLTHQLLTFSNGGRPVLENIDIIHSLKEACTFAARGNSIKLEFHLPRQSVFVEADDGQIRQVFQNIVLNACQAMSEGGVVQVQGVVKEIAPDQMPPLKAGRYVEVKVADSGSGIAPEILPHIFEPYFSTKKEGSGLGLAIAHSVVQKHKGHISVFSEVGSGAVFSVYLPISENGKAAVKEAANPNSGRRKGGRVLIMDDVMVVRLTLSMLLKQLGFVVDESENGEEALKIFEENLKNNISYRFVITDLTVPGGMGGRELARKISELAPSLPVIVTSGYSEDAEIARYKDFGFAAVLRKPYSVPELEKVIRSVEQSAPIQ
jgi:signal transduction histidine kinase/CheY-like chemotaxis protein